MISSEVQRTLVKSPPELWAELSDPAALAGHLSELGEIRITRVEAEQKVEWQAGVTSGTVVIKPSGWGTKVKLTVTRELPEHETSPPDEDSAAPEPEAAARETASAAEPETAFAPERAPGITPEPQAAIAREGEDDTGVGSRHERRPLTAPVTHAGSARGSGSHGRSAVEAAEIAAEPESEHVAEAEPEHEPPPAPAPRRGFFARLFGRRRAAKTEQAPIDEVPGKDLASDRPPAAPTAEEGVPAEYPAQLDEPRQPEVGGGISEGMRVAEEIVAEQVTAVLTGVLDRLGAAHHRPFSRS